MSKRPPTKVKTKEIKTDELIKSLREMMVERKGEDLEQRLYWMMRTKWRVTDTLLDAYRKLSSLAEAMERWDSSLGQRCTFNSDEKFARLKYPDPMHGFGDILMGIAGDLALLYERIEGENDGEKEGDAGGQEEA